MSADVRLDPDSARAIRDMIAAAVEELPAGDTKYALQYSGNVLSAAIDRADNE